MDNQSVDDLLSDLPLSIIHCILTRLQIQVAVRTCVLSSKWRYKWASLPHLVFDNTCVAKGGKSVSIWRDCMNNFISRALFLHKGPIHKFRLSADLKCPNIDRWLLHLSRNEIREIFIKQSYYKVILVHSCLYFHYSGNFKKMRLHAPLVAEVFVKLTDIQLLAVELQKSPVCNYTNFFRGCPNLERFTGTHCFTEYLSIGIKSYRHSLVLFRHLKFIQLSQVSFADMKQMSVLGYLIMGAPNLQELIIDSSTYVLESSNRFSHLDFGFPPNFTLEKLRVVSIRHVCGLPYMMELIKHLLKSSPVLETVKLYYLYRVLSENRLYVATKLIRYCRASPNAEIFLL